MTSRILGTTLILAALASCGAAAEAEPGQLDAALAAAKPGTVIELPAGELKRAIVLPPGVSLKGAGYAKTILDATGNKYGISLTGGSGSTISDLTIRNASAANINIKDAQKAALQRLRCTGGLMGVNMQGGKGCRIENVLSDGNRYGIIVAQGQDQTVVNCSAIANTTVGISFPSGKGTVAFNNLVTDSALAVNVGDLTEGLVLDHNLYLGMDIGKSPKANMQRETLNDWQYTSGLDAHSVSLPVKFAAAGLYVPTNVLEWSHDRVATAQWGAAQLAGRSAPAQDIDGQARPKQPGLGAFEATAVQPPRPADGTFTVPEGKGLVSAGVFDAKGKLVAYLFQCLPLEAGQVPFWLPARDWQGQPIAAGKYEVRVVRGDLEWKSVGWFGNTQKKDPMGYGAPCTHAGLAFDKAGRLYIGNAISDVFSNVRCADGKTGQWLWTIQGMPREPGPAVAVPSDGLMYIMRDMGDQGMRVTRMDGAKGAVVLGADPSGHIALPEGKTYTGMTSVGSILAYTDTAKNAVRFGTIQAPAPTKSVEVPAPSRPAGDEQSGVVWVISGGEKLVAIKADGGIVGESTAVPKPIALAAGNGQLAVASLQTGKVHLFDASNPAELKPLKEIGRGDGPQGKILSDRFFFQNNPKSSVDLAIGPAGELAVADDWRIQVFEPDGKLRWMSWGIVGSGVVPSKATPGRIYDVFGYTYQADGTKGTFVPESYHPQLYGMQGPDQSIVSDCRIGGQDFVFKCGRLPGMQQWGVTWTRFTLDKCQDVLRLEQTKEGGYLWRRDSDGNGTLDDKDATTPLTDAEGKPVEKMQLFHHMYNASTADGTVICAQVSPAGSWLATWKCSGLDENGIPIYKWKDRQAWPGLDKCISPYTWKPDQVRVGQLEERRDGGWYVLGGYASNPAHGKSPFNNGGIDIFGLNKDGSLDWVRPFGHLLHIGGFCSGNGLVIGGHAINCDYHVMTDEGLAVSGFSSPGVWLDHVQALVSFIDAEGKLNVMATDCTKASYDWFRLVRCDIQRTVSPLEVSAELAGKLAAIQAVPGDVRAGKPPVTVVHIPRLKEPLPIDGKNDKWVKAGIAPQIIITPESGARDIEGGVPDCSMLLRLAWHGQDLYLQAIKFDDIITTQNPHARAYLGDHFEIGINGYLEGIKIGLYDTSDKGPTIDVCVGYEYKCNILTPQHAPRVIKSLESAEDFPERKVLEDIAGRDLTNCEVQLYEARIPIDAETTKGFESRKTDIKAGGEFWLGLYVMDNDEPATDTLRMIAWPAAFNIFMRKDVGVNKAVFDE